MEIPTISALLLVLLVAQLHGSAAITAGAPDGAELWGYTNIRPKAHLFWWYLRSPQRVSSPAKAWPTILCLPGSLGVSAVGRGNFQEIGPLDVNLKPRNWTWLQMADLLFVDNPVGVGYSYVDDPSALAKTDLQAAMDVTELLKVVVKEIPELQGSPLYLVGEFYGGKLAAMIGTLVARAIHAGTLHLKLGGVALGDSWISPDDFALSYAQLLHDVSRLNDNAVGEANKMAATVKEQMLAGQFAAARKTWTDLLSFIDSISDSVNMENFLLDTGMNPVFVDDSRTSSPSLRSTQLIYISSQAPVSATNSISGIMNGVIKKKLKIIPKDLTWQEASIQVYDALANNFMKPAINEVDELLSYGVNVTVYNGQLDVICSTIGAEAWVKKLKWQDMKAFLSLSRQPLYYCDPPNYCSRQIKSYIRSYKNLQFYWVLNAGQFVPIDQPYVAFKMMASITQSPGN
ncbi:hypothetical protein ACP70R_009167 [Stipagrostis hirtigluma subsp. patula]